MPPSVRMLAVRAALAAGKGYAEQSLQSFFPWGLRDWLRGHPSSHFSIKLHGVVECVLVWLCVV